MKLDIKARLRNKYFWVSFISLVVLLLEQLGIELPFDISSIGGTLLSMLVLLGIVVDNGSPTAWDNGGKVDKNIEEDK